MLSGRHPASPAAGMPRGLRIGLLHVLLLAILVRLCAFLVFEDMFDFVLTGRIHGSEAYDTYAVNLVRTGVFGRTPSVADSAIPPLYAYTLGLIYAAFGRGAFQVLFLNILLDVLSIAFLADVGRRLFPQGRTVGLLAGLALALYPYLVFQTLTLIDTPLFGALLNAFIWIVVIVRERARTDGSTVAVAAAGGVVLGLATLTRPVLAPLALLIPAWFLFRRSWRDTILRLAPIALFGAAVVGVWTFRNERVYGRFLPITSTAGSNFWQGNSPLVIPLLRAGYDVQWTAPDSLAADDPRSPEADEERFHLAWTFLREHPDQIGELLWVKLLTQWSIDVAPRFNPNESTGPIVDVPGRAEGFETPSLSDSDPINLYSQPLFDRFGRWLHRLVWGSLFLLAVAGSFLARRQWRDVSLIWFLELSMTAAYVVFHPATRYRAPGDPMLFLLSAFAVVRLWVWARARRATLQKPNPASPSPS